MNEQYDAEAQFSEFFLSDFHWIVSYFKFFYLFSLSSSREA